MGKKLTSNKAKQILHDKEIKGHSLTDKQRKFFGAIAGGAEPLNTGGWLDKYTPKAQNGIEGTMGGLTDIGFDYNGAWGGPSMQMGGSIPGTVGFTYARTQDPAPSNGPYAKKTMSSAQDGKKVFNKKVSESTFVNRDRRIPSSKDIIKKIPGTSSYKDVYGNLLEKDDKGVYKPIQKEVEEVKKYTPQSTLSKVKEIALNPMTAIGYKVRNENIPENFSRSEDTRNNLDTAVDFINPAWYAESAKNLVQSQGQVFSDLSEGNFQDAGINQLVAGVETLNFIPVAKYAKKPLQKGLQQTGEYLTTKTPLKNTYKINPWAFKPSSEMGYRMLGKEGFEDALESGVLRAKPAPNQPTNGGISLARNTNRNPNTGKMQGALDRPYFADGFIDERYASDYMAAVNKVENNLVPIPTHKGIAPSTPTNIPIENAQFYKKDWLQGYKQIPKQEDGGVIKDDLGQWAHPGEITEIGSNNITMEGVPYDVLGISDTGDVKLMKPGKNYKFKGKKVTEFPMAKNGLRQEQKGLVNLDNLTNFTNYNTKQPGGWLDKY